MATSEYDGCKPSHPPVAQMVEHSTVVGSKYCSLFFAAYRMVAGSIPAGGKLVFLQT